MSQDVPESLIACQSPEAQAIIRLLLAQIAELKARVAELESQLGRTPQNSSLPPSSQHPHAKPAKLTKGPRRQKSKKKRGGQPGHKKHERPLIPTKDCDETLDLKPTKCRQCGETLRGSDADPLRHQVRELPEVKPHVTVWAGDRRPHADWRGGGRLEFSAGLIGPVPTRTPRARRVGAFFRGNPSPR